MAKLVAKTYGDALFELAVELNKLDVFAEEIQVLTEVFKENGELMKLMNHPKIDKQEKLQVMDQILKSFVSEEVAGFVNVIIAKDRYREWESIFQYFIDSVKEYQSIGNAFVTTAVELKDAQKKKVEEKLLETTKYKKIDICFQVDSSIIGGMMIRIGDRVVDSSIRTKLYELTKDLTKIQLA